MMVCARDMWKGVPFYLTNNRGNGNLFEMNICDKVS